MSSDLEQSHILRDTVRSTEETLRAYDLKSEIGMICLVLSIEAIHVFVDLGRLRTTHPALAIVMFVLFIASMVGYMTVLLPIYKRKPADASSYSGANLFFVTRGQSVDAAQYVRSLERADFRQEMAHQIIMLSEIRDSKNQRFLVALFITLAFYAVALAAGWFGMLGARTP